MSRRHDATTDPGAEMTFGLAAHHYLAAGVDEVQALRCGVGGTRGQPIPAGQLKHVDDQTLVALAAVLAAAAAPELADVDLGDWAVLAAPRFLGRRFLAEQFVKFEKEGAWGVSPHCIPHRCLHSISGALSQFLQMRGPNFGCGGGPGGDGEALLSAAALLAGEDIPGCWLVLSGGAPEPTPVGEVDDAPWRLHALALALLPGTQANCRLVFRLAAPTAAPATLASEAADQFLLRLNAALMKVSSCQLPTASLNLAPAAPVLIVEPNRAFALAPHRQAA
jgi:hypothetical protein